VVGGAVLRHPGKMLAEAAVEALDHAVGVRPEGLREAVGDRARGADPVEEVVARGSVLGFCLLVDGEAVGELGAVVGQSLPWRRPGMVWTSSGKQSRKRVRKAAAVAVPAIGENFEIDKPGGAIDGDPSLRWGRL
jgi:hypothetical protein